MSSDLSQMTFKIATEDWEFEEIHRLNYKTFVEEIPQHPPHPSQKLVDKFHDENTYFICLRDDELIAMVAVRNQRPFSLDKKLDDLESYLPEANSMCEIRLLAVQKEYRQGLVPYKLLKKMGYYCQEKGYELWLISGTTRELKLYEHIGFVPFGPQVGPPEARYQPMYLTLETAEKKFLGPGNDK